MIKNLFLCVLLCGLCFSACAQSLGTLRGQVADESAAVIPGAKVTATGPDGLVKTATTVGDGTYTLTGLTPGAWTVIASSAGLRQQTPAKVNISGGVQTLNLVLRVELEKQEVTVQEQSNNVVSTDPSQNAGALVLKGEDLEALSDDPDDMQQDLQALAGPAAGPNGGQIYIDGFTGGRLPPKESIREIRINQNPFSSEFDRLGYGRIEIFTKPGTDKFHGSGMFMVSDGAFNARNPFLLTSNMPGFTTTQEDGNLSGPLSKKASFFLDLSRREINDSSVINARIVDPVTFLEEPYSIAPGTAQKRDSFSPRIDYALTPNNTLMARYTYTRSDQPFGNVGGFMLPSQGISSLTTQQTGQLTETSVINSKWINETRLQIMNDQVNQNGSLLPVISVSGAFSDGGSGIGQSWNWQRHYEVQNYTSTTKGAHSIKFGVRVRTIEESDFSQRNFGGTYTFSAPSPTLGLGPLTSLDAYRITLMGLAQGLSMAQIQAMGGGPSQFTINTGTPLATVSQTDVGFFYQDDWRIKPNITLSLGGRYETQTNLHDWSDFAPRVGFAWAPGGGAMGPFARPKLVIRGGFGVFYDRLSQLNTLTVERFDTLQQSLRTNDPTLLALYPNLPPLGALTQSSAIKYAIDKNFHAPYVAQSAISVERQLPKNTSLNVTFMNTRGVHQLLERDINAPLPGTFTLGDPASGVRPYGNVGDIYNYESTGILNQNQLMVNVNSRIGTKLSLFGGYFLSRAMSNVPNGLPSNDYNLGAEYGRASFDVRHRAMLVGSITTKWNVVLSPFIILASGSPFNILSPVLAPNSSFSLRPAFAPPGATGPNIVTTQYGSFDLDPYLPDGSVKPGETIIPRNYGQNPAMITVNLRLSRTWGFGPERASSASNSGAGGGGAPRGGGGGGGPHGPGGPGGYGGPRGGMGGMGFGGGGTASTRRYQVTASINARNLLNHTNYGPINNILGSPTFGQSTTLAGGYGAEQYPLDNRRLDFQLRFTF